MYQYLPIEFYQQFLKTLMTVLRQPLQLLVLFVQGGRPAFKSCRQLGFKSLLLQRLTRLQSSKSPKFKRDFVVSCSPGSETVWAKQKIFALIA